MNKKRLLSVLPYFYFIAIISWMAIHSFSTSDQLDKPLVLLLFSTPFMIQIFRPSKLMDITLSFICFFWSAWMLMAFLSDLSGIEGMANSSWSFTILGGLICLTNFGMTTLLFRNIFPSHTPQKSTPSIQ